MVLAVQEAVVAVRTAAHLLQMQKQVALAVLAVIMVIQMAAAQAELEPMARPLVRLLAMAEPLNQHQVAQVVADKVLLVVRQHYCPKRALMRLLLHLSWATWQVVEVAEAVMLRALLLRQALVAVVAVGLQEPQELHIRFSHHKCVVSVVMVLLYGAKQHRGGI